MVENMKRTILDNKHNWSHLTKQMTWEWYEYIQRF